MNDPRLVIGPRILRVSALGFQGLESDPATCFSTITAAIAAAVALAVPPSETNPIYIEIEPGDYSGEAAIALASHVHLIGKGNSEIGGVQVTDLNYTPTDALRQDLLIRGLNFEGALGLTVNTSLTPGRATRVRVEDCQFFDLAISYTGQADGQDFIVIRSCTRFIQDADQGATVRVYASDLDDRNASNGARIEMMGCDVSGGADTIATGGVIESWGCRAVAGVDYARMSIAAPFNVPGNLVETKVTGFAQDFSAGGSYFVADGMGNVKFKVPTNKGGKFRLTITHRWDAPGIHATATRYRIRALLNGGAGLDPLDWYDNALDTAAGTWPRGGSVTLDTALADGDEVTLAGTCGNTAGTNLEACVFSAERLGA